MGTLLRLLIFSGVAFLGWFVFSQMIVPAYKDTPSFPLFRRTAKKKEQVREEIRGLHAKGEVADLEKKAAALKLKNEKKGLGPKKEGAE